MGSDAFYAEERPARTQTVAEFFIDIHLVTNHQFAQFVTATDYVTTAEKRGGSFVFTPPDRPVNLKAEPSWWQEVEGASWRHPDGRAVSMTSIGRHPVVHISLNDALAYAQWAGKRLPTEIEWERAARGGLINAIYAWGDRFRPEGRYMANSWQGEFPLENLGEDGFMGRSPVGSFPPNGYGLYDMIGNVWEWTMTASTDTTHPCICGIGTQTTDDMIVKGGSYLCAPNYCRRYRPAARMAQPVSTTTGHIGFRCAA